MNTLKNILGIAFVVLLMVSCKNETKTEVISVDTSSEKTIASLDPNANYAKAEFTIEGMTCEIGCAKTIEKKLAKMEGVKSATVDFDKKLAMVEFDDALVTTTSLEETVIEVADIYTVKDMHTVDTFEAKAGKSKSHECAEDCKMACCKDKTAAEKKACAEDCKKACCADKA